MASSNLERLSVLESYNSSSLVRCGNEAYSGREIRNSGDLEGEMREGGRFERSMPASRDCRSEDIA